MTMLRRILLACLFSGLVGEARAEREVHVVAVGTGYRTDDFYALPLARVVVDRPGQEVGLVLLDGGDIDWRVEATVGTSITEILRSGPGAGNSEVSLSGIPMVGVETPGLPLVLNPWGRDFRKLLDILADRLGTERIHSFQATHQIREGPLRVDHVDTKTAGLARDYLSHLLGDAADLPPKLRNWIEDRGVNGDFVLTFDETGIILTGPSGTRLFAPTPDVPEIVLPVRGVYDPGSQMIYCITYGAEGYIYSVDVRSGEWAVVTSLEDYDAAGLLYDPDSRQLITTGAFSRPGAIRVFGLDGSRSSIFIPTTAFPGLTDLFDYGNEHGPPLIPRAYSDGWLLLEALASPESGNSLSEEYRIYAVLITTGEVRLLRFRNGSG